MTKDFNKQPRDDRRPDSRGSSPRRYGEERSPRPARPRLNRDMVDRAWENGARQNHADYRTRSDSNSRPQRDYRRPNQQSAQNSNYGRKPYGNRQDSYRPGERSPRSNNGARPGPYDSSMRTFNEQSYHEYKPRGYSNQPHQDEYRSDNHGNAQRPSSRPQYQGRNPYNGPQRREFNRDNRSPRSFDRDQRQSREYDRDSRQPRGYDRDKRSYRDASRPETQNARQQSRPARQHDNYSTKPDEPTRYRQEQELFEGDYEHFDVSNSANSGSHQTRADTSVTQSPEELPVTRLPDGRVLKGTPKEQQRNAEFWTEITQESDGLVKPIASPNIQEVDAKHPASTPTAASSKGKSKPRARTASATTRERKTSKTKARQSTPKPRSTGPKPSQRGYKWPTPEE